MTAYRDWPHPWPTPYPALSQAEAQRGGRIRDRYRERFGTLRYVRWPELEVRWDDRPDAMARVVPYTISRLRGEEAL